MSMTSCQHEADRSDNRKMHVIFRQIRFGCVLYAWRQSITGILLPLYTAS